MSMYTSELGVAVETNENANNSNLPAQNSAASKLPESADPPIDRTPHGDVELTILMPCLDEAATVATCVRKAIRFAKDNSIEAEILVADNGSTDGSQQLAHAAGARVVNVTDRGYGAALLGGIHAARGKYVIMGDADDSYDFCALAPFIQCLRGGADLVMGNRFQGGIARGAMPPLHRYLGNPVLSFIGRLFFGVKVGDFHCGLRGFRRESVIAMGLQTTGMEFASEMVVRATLAGHRVEEVPTTLSPDGRNRAPHLRSWRDGWRHLRFLLLFSPRWLFLIPGLLLLGLGLIFTGLVLPGPLKVGGVTLDVNTLVIACATTVVGFQSVLCALLAQVHGVAEGFLPEDPRLKKALEAWTLERGLRLGALVACAGFAGLVTSLARWHAARFGGIDYETSLRLVVPASTALIASWQIVLGSFVLHILRIRSDFGRDTARQR